MSKVKQKIEINGIPFGIGSIGMKDGTFKELPANVKQGNKLTTLSHLRNCIQQGECHGEFTIGNKSGYLFKFQDNNVLVDKDVRMVIAAYKDKTEEPLHICKGKINKKSIKPLEVEPSIQYNNQINFDTILLTDHFIEQVRDRFFITDKNLMRLFIKDVVTNGEYMGISKDKDEKEAHKFSKRGIALFISLDYSAAKSAYEIEKINSIPKQDIRSYIQRKIKKLKEDESKLNNTYSIIKDYEIEREIVECNIALLRARSDSRRNVLQGRINALTIEREERKNERYQATKTLRDYQKSLVAFT